MVSIERQLTFVGSSREDLRECPLAVRRKIGEQLRNVQRGLMPTEFKPMSSIGSGVYEIRVRLDGAWRAIYVAKFSSSIYVLHVFQKKTQQTAKDDIDLAAARYRMIGE
jgi:phage-related protein